MGNLLIDKNIQPLESVFVRDMNDLAHERRKRICTHNIALIQ